MARALVYEDNITGWRTMVNGDLPTSGVTAATYGDASHVAQVAVNAQGIITSASNVAISGGSSPLTTKGDIYGHSTVDARIPVGSDNQVLIADSTQTLGVKWGTVPSGAPGSGLKKLFSTTLVATGALDTGANGIPSGHGSLYIVALMRSALAATFDTPTPTLNGSTGYDVHQIGCSGTSVSVTNNTAQNHFGLSSIIFGDTGPANYASPVTIFIPFYDNTTWNKTGWLETTEVGSTGNNDRTHKITWTWRSTAAVNQVTIDTASHLLAGSSMTVYGTE